MSKMGCELCSNNPARIYCESDQASLCWNCDEKVHSANFLVAKHSRNLLCHVCQSSTSWKASGLKIGPTVSICHVCADGENGGISRRRHGEDGDCEAMQESEEDDGEYYSEEEDEEEEGENQVVPWSNSSSTVPLISQPVTASFASEDHSSSTSLKRMRDNAFESEDEEGCCSSRFNPRGASASEIASTSYGELSENINNNNNKGSSSSSSSFRPLKSQKENRTVEMKSRRAAIIGSLRKFQQETESCEGDPSTMIKGLSKLSRD